MKKTIISLFMLCAMLMMPLFANADMQFMAGLSKEQKIQILIQEINRLERLLNLEIQLEAQQNIIPSPAPFVTPITNNQAPITPKLANPIISDQSVTPSPAPIISDIATPTPLPASPAPVVAAIPTMTTYSINAINNNIQDGLNDIYSFTVNNSTGNTMTMGSMVFNANIGSSDNFQNMPRLKVDGFGNGLCDVSLNGQLDPYYVEISAGLTSVNYSGNNKIYLSFDGNHGQIANGQSITFVLKCQLINFNVGDSMTTTLIDNGAGQKLDSTTLTK
jgi:hypothetical protein